MLPMFKPAKYSRSKRVGLAERFQYGNAVETFARVDKNIANLISNFNTISGKPTCYDRYTFASDAVEKMRKERQSLGKACTKVDVIYNKGGNVEKATQDCVRILSNLAQHAKTLEWRMKELIEAMSKMERFELWKAQHPLIWLAITTVAGSASKIVMPA